MSANKSILICRCCERGLVDANAVSDLIASGQAAVVPDLCRAALENDSVLEIIASGERPVIYACHPRAVKALFAFAGHPLPASAEFINLRIPALPTSQTPNLSTSPTRSAWFPVIDEDRCSRCGQCFEFCLFGVYEKDPDGRVRVAHPQSCKNNCPACARICPETAIIFPKVGESPINGAEVSDDEERKANIKINVDELLGSDVYAALNARKQKRQSLLNQKKVEKALAERRSHSENS
ncbi:MAG: 4Fe-4S binding protein [Pontiellaceae bacterium]|jgi:NAD-dependent dihydropyrimidine dehydrogenase PreA subunit|nr:4Fe-4S binding protein [Pontiellaceae bacterium]